MGPRRPIVPVYYFSFSSEHWVPNFEQTESTESTIASRLAPFPKRLACRGAPGPESRRLPAPTVCADDDSDHRDEVELTDDRLDCREHPTWAVRRG